VKKIVTVAEVEGEGLMTYLGDKVTLFCMNYIYTGTLSGVNDTCVELTDASIVYETGSFTDSGWKDAQRLSGERWFVQTAAIESFGPVK
jgi:hypothetical protein